MWCVGTNHEGPKQHIDQLRSCRKRTRSIGRLATVTIAGNELIRVL